MRALLATILLAALPALFAAKAPPHEGGAAQVDAARVKACEKARKEVMAEPACADEARSAQDVHCDQSYAQIFPLAKTCDDKTGKSIIPRTKPLKGTAVAPPPASAARPSRPKKAKTHSTFVEYTPTPTP